MAFSFFVCGFVMRNQTHTDETGKIEMIPNDKSGNIVGDSILYEQQMEDYKNMKDYEYQLKYGNIDYLLASDTKELRELFQKNMDPKPNTLLTIETYDLPFNIDDTEKE